MKKIFSIFVVLLIAVAGTGCSKKAESKPELFSAEAFAYDMETSWEINSSIRVKGFEQEEQSAGFSHSLSYTVSLVTPSGENISDFAKGTLKDTPKEKQTDLGIEAQYELDKSKGPGKYKVVYSIKDDLTGKTANSEKELEVL